MTYIIANWKVNPTSLNKAKELFNGIRQGIEKINPEQTKVVICPPFVYLERFKFKDLRFKLGAQDCFWEEQGAYTGEISPLMLKDLGCDYVILGHSERRAIFDENNEMIRKKIAAALDFDLKVILCIGETRKEKEEGRTKEVLRTQIKESLTGISKQGIIIAYEPRWAIGTGNPCSGEQAEKAVRLIREQLESIIDKDLIETPILYGGSVDSENVISYLEAGFQGVLVGGASLEAKEFVKIIKAS